MVSQNLVAFDSAALTLVLADGDDLHVHGGPEEKPRWVRTAPARLLAVGAGGGLVTTLDARGVLTWWTGSGEVYSSSTLDDAAFGLATAPDGQACAVLFPDRVVLVERGAREPYASDRGRDGRRLLGRRRARRHRDAHGRGTHRHLRR